MKHAGKQTLELLEPVLRELRKKRVLAEKRPGSFYVKSTAFLHFHEDEAGIFADVKEDWREFTRHRVSTRTEQRSLLARIDRCLKAHSD